MVMTATYLPIHLDVQKSIPKNQSNLNNVPSNNEVANRRRSNSQSQVVSTPATENRTKEKPNKRNQILYFVTLAPLNDTFIKKHLLVPYFPETRKLGRPAGSKVKPDITNGFFDSRVLSRSHAAMFIDSSSGKLMLKDLGSSNGTYVNEERIGIDPVEIKIGDIIYLGFNIQADTNHKQISAKVENINVMQNFYASSSAMPSSFNFKNQQTIDTPEFKHYNFIQDIISKIPNTNKVRTNELHLSFENALFGDINPNFEDTLLGLNSNGNCGIFNNAQITNASSLDSATNVLAMNLSKIKQQNNTLATLEEFIINYQARLNELNSNFLKQEFETKLKRIQGELSKEKSATQETKDKHNSYEAEVSRLLEQLRKEVVNLTDERHSLNKKINEISDSKERKNENFSKSMETNENYDNTDNATSGDYSIDNICTNGIVIIGPSKSPNNANPAVIQNVEDKNDKNLSNVKHADSPILNTSDKKDTSSEEYQQKLTPRVSNAELETSRETPDAVENSQNIESDRSVVSPNIGVDHKKKTFTEMLHLLPLKHKITLALYIALFALVLQSIYKNQEIIFGLSIVLFISVFQSSLNRTE